MKLLSIFLFVASIALTIGCEWGWTGCEGMLRGHDAVCKEYYFDEFANDSSGSGCSWVTLKRKCRRGERVCQWTGCEGAMRPPQEVCDQYGYGEPVELSPSDCKFDSQKLQCCTKCSQV